MNSEKTETFLLKIGNMYLIDTNILIYSYSNQYEYLKSWFYNVFVQVSEISRIEVLGYHKISATEETYYRKLFSVIPSILPTQEIFDKAIAVRRTYNIKLPDSIIMATALINDLTVITSDNDFTRVPNLKFNNPVKEIL